MPDETLLVAVLDACVLYPPSLRDLFMRLASALVFQPRWTEEIHAEWMRNVLEDRPQITRAQLERTRRLMDQISDESLVSGAEAHVAALSLPDPNDRHVLAAAIQAEAAVIVTFTYPTFPKPRSPPSASAPSILTSTSWRCWMTRRNCSCRRSANTAPR